MTRTGAVLIATTISLPFVGVRLSEMEQLEVDTAAAVNMSEIALQEDIAPNPLNDAIVKATDPAIKYSGPVVVDTYITGVPKPDDYPRMKGAYYSR